jgi:hypothetical protein
MSLFYIFVLYFLFYTISLYYYSLCTVNFKKEKIKQMRKNSPLPSSMEKMFC